MYSPPTPHRWTVADALEAYSIRTWGAGYYGIIEPGKQYSFGLEAGSKPELLAVMALLEDEEALIICNGYKDEEYVETALYASKLGRSVILVVEKASELRLIADIS